jgi:WD and tetratricopeptide repeat-containing protein 1
LPSKLAEYKKKYRSLASTFVTFSPDGKELLVNLGGEQIYLFPINGNWQSEVCNLVVPDLKGCINGGMFLKL